jgi:AraC-like DNA-binding protein
MTKPSLPNAISTIDCFRMIFPESDPLALAAYSKMMLPLFEFDVPDLGGKTPFSCEAEIYCLPDVTVSRTRATASRFTRTVRTIARSATDDILAVCYTNGHFAYRIGDETRRVEQGELAFFDLSQEIVIEAPSVENISLAIQRRKLEPAIPLLDSAHGLVVRPGALSRVLIGMMEHTMEMGPTIQATQARPIAEAMILLVKSCLETIPQSKATADIQGSTVSLASVKAAIERGLTDPNLGVQSLLEEFGMTRSTLYRAFEPLGGVTAYITERRLRHAFRRMTDPAEKTPRVSNMAFELGFAHASTFTRSFKALFGLTPKDIRTLAIRPAGQDIPFAVSPEAIPYIHPLVPEPIDAGSKALLGRNS